jgi:hypothetical protein
MTTVETEYATIRHLVSCLFSGKITFRIKNVFLCNESTQLKTFEENYFYLSTNPSSLNLRAGKRNNRHIK